LLSVIYRPSYFIYYFPHDPSSSYQVGKNFKRHRKSVLIVRI